MSIKKIDLAIDEKARSYAKIYASLIPDAFQRKRANAAITALFAYVGMIKKTTDVNVQNSMTLYRNPSLCEQYEIADCYINNFHIDVRVTVDSDTALVPRIHYDNLITPDFYVVINVDSNLKTAQFAGVIDTAVVQPEPCDFHYYKVTSDSFISNEEFLARIKNEKVYNFDESEHELFRNNYLSFIDNEISKQRKNEILKHLFKCSECRTEFCCFTGFEMVNCNINKYPEILMDQTLYIIGAQSVEDENYEGKEEKIYIGKEEQEKGIPTLNSEITNPLPTGEYTIKDETVMDYVPYDDFLPPNQEQENQEETEEAVPDDNIIDELFSEDDIFQNETQPEEQQKDEILEQEKLQEQTIENEEALNTEQNLTQNNELQYENTEQKDETFDTLQTEENNNVQKVIIDYDEFGEPIYSYITNADGTGPASVLTENDESAADVNNEEKAESNYNIENETLDNIQDIITDTQENELLEEYGDISELASDDAGDGILDEMIDVQKLSDEPDEKNDDLTQEEENNFDDEFSDIFGTDDLSQELNTEDSKKEEQQDEIISLNEETTENIQSIDGFDESNILDQMFVDGALEREAKEQQDVSYSPLGTPVDSYIPAPNNNDAKTPDTIHSDEVKPVENNEEAQSEEKKEEEEKEDIPDKLISDEQEEIIEENPIEVIEEDEEDNPLIEADENNEELIQENSNETENITDEALEEEPVTLEENSNIIENETPVNSDNDFEITLDTDEDTKDTNNQDIEIKQEEQTDNNEEDNITYLTDEQDKLQEKGTDDDELLSVLPSETQNSNVQMFDGYIESEILKNDEEDNEEDEEDEYDDDEDDEYDDDEDEDDEEGDEDMNDENSKGSSLKKIIIMLSIIGALLIACGVSAFFFLKNRDEVANEATIVQAQPLNDETKNELADDMFDIPIDDSSVVVQLGDENKEQDKKVENNTNTETKDAEITLDSDTKEPEKAVSTQNSNVKTLTEKDLTNTGSNGDINKAITKALSVGENLVTLRSVNWSCASELFSDIAFKNYMQNLDNTLKQNLKNNIMGVTEIPPKNKVTVKFAVDNQRNLRKVLITESSNSEEVDKIVLRSINETFEGEKSPILTDSPLKADIYYFKVVINL